MKKIDSNALLKAIIFGLFGIAVFYMGYTDHLALILHPKMFKFTYFAGFIFLLISAYMTTRIRVHSKKKADLRILVFLLPIFFMFTEIQPLKGDALRNMSYDVLSNSKRIAQANLEGAAAQKAQAQTQAQTQVQAPDVQEIRKKIEEDLKKEELQNPDLNNPVLKNADINNPVLKNVQNAADSGEEGAARGQETIGAGGLEDPGIREQNEGGFLVPQDHNVVNNSSIIIDTNISAGDEPLYLPSVSETKGKNYDIAKFLDDMLEAYSFSGDGANKFDHQDFEIVGFVYRDDYFDSNRFMVGRILLTCCISDAQQIGVLVEGQEDYTGKFLDDSWVKVRGKLFWQELYNPNTKEDLKVLTLKPTKIEQIEDIAYPYVYFE